MEQTIVVSPPKQPANWQNMRWRFEDGRVASDESGKLDIDIVFPRFRNLHLDELDRRDIAERIYHCLRVCQGLSIAELEAIDLFKTY